ncbi:hypothetical protein Clacol_000131 [Clathrus columnatus]|uniref:Uncharacterized protein n=1 Tax=Clathrus columnatus TaxID=1419009 RepID=A0AAV4ZYD2_9AGAM|nr:hypothetical protein Clacol_000131 [Clathrus columnatus]
MKQGKGERERERDRWMKGRKKTYQDLKRNFPSWSRQAPYLGVVGFSDESIKKEGGTIRKYVAMLVERKPAKTSREPYVKTTTNSMDWTTGSN